MQDSDNSGKIPFKTALTWILISVVVTSGLALLSMLYYRHVSNMHTQDDAYQIVAVIQTTPEKESLKTVYLAELLNLSVDQPTNLFVFNTKEASRKLSACPFIKDATVKKIRPGTVYVDYVLREPIAFLLDYTNTVIDKEGVAFPFKPIFTPKRLPEVYVGYSQMDGSTVSNGVWGSAIQGARAEKAMALLEFVSKHCCSETTHLRRIDVSQAEASSCGQRQLVVILDDHTEQIADGKSSLYISPMILRLNPENYQQGLANYRALHKHLVEYLERHKAEKNASVVQRSPTIIDLRLPHLAYIKYGQPVP